MAVAATGGGEQIKQGLPADLASRIFTWSVALAV